MRKMRIDRCRCGATEPYLNEHFTRESRAVIYTIHCAKCGRTVADVSIADVVYDWNHYPCHGDLEKKLHACLNLLIEASRQMYERGGVAGLKKAADLAEHFYYEMDEALFHVVRENAEISDSMASPVKQ